MSLLFTSFFCLNHLNEHVEIKKQNKRQLDNLRNESNTAINGLKLIVEEKLLIIGREQYLIEQAKQILDVPTSSIDELQNLLDRINQAIPFSRSDVVEEFGISKNDRYSMQIDDDAMDATSFDTTTKSLKVKTISSMNS
ncbi:unnamed protein product [Rotaria magnacalcarata]|uniref:Uncharacterized protein n=1 Tax=Rotaria magnacalcarata TaxID=392030 RepID=A0A8S3BK56_9BILA|nr:unnamed protein product [Rotaria magnacalcarata]